jgi:hypothetical protein
MGVFLDRGIDDFRNRAVMPEMNHFGARRHRLAAVIKRTLNGLLELDGIVIIFSGAELIARASTA